MEVSLVIVISWYSQYGILYCNGVDVIDTQIRDTPSEFSSPIPGDSVNGQNCTAKEDLNSVHRS